MFLQLKFLLDDGKIFSYSYLYLVVYCVWSRSKLFAKVFGEVCFMDFSGLSGATALSAIAFSVVFLVLTGLTCVIYAMRIVSKSK